MILRTTNGGETWASQSIATAYYLWGVSFIDSNVATVVGSGGTILRTTDGGETWTSQSSGTTHNLYAVSFTDANTGTAVGEYGTILRTTTGGVTGVKNVPNSEDDMPNQFVLEQNYPNPFNPSTIISYRLPTNVLVTLTVYDVLGREVWIPVNERQTAGTHSVTFDASNLPGGVYFYRLQAGPYVETKKLILLR
jgi:hypothetical protein